MRRIMLPSFSISLKVLRQKYEFGCLYVGDILLSTGYVLLFIFCDKNQLKLMFPYGNGKINGSLSFLNFNLKFVVVWW